jgi:hypothetical protein
MVVVLQEGRVGGVQDESMTNKETVKTWQQQKKRSWETNSAEIRNPFGRRCLLFICQICNFNKNRVEGCRDVPLGLLLFPLVTRRKKRFHKKKYHICQFSRKVMAHQPADTIATAFRMTSMLVRPTTLLE